MQNTYLNGVEIRVEPYDLEYTGYDYKLDLLFYNNVNRYGEILTSLVYNSGVRDSNDISYIIYNPNKLFLNTSFEQGYTLTGTSNRWKNADLLTTGTSMLRDNSSSATYTYSHYDVATDNAVTYQNGDHSYDGWYTMVSIVLKDHADSAAVLQGTLRNNTGTAQYAIQDNPTLLAHWSDLDDIDTTIDIYNFLREDRSDTYLSFDFVVTTKIHSLHKKLLDEKLEDMWFKRVNMLSPKMKTLEAAIDLENYDKAQHMINAVQGSLLSLLI
jgi:hypothetical protein